MFWIAILGLSFSSMLIKLGHVSATASILTFVVKLLILGIFVGLLTAAWLWYRKKNADASDKN